MKFMFASVFIMLILFALGCMDNHSVWIPLKDIDTQSAAAYNEDNKQ